MYCIYKSIYSLLLLGKRNMVSLSSVSFGTRKNPAVSKQRPEIGPDQKAVKVSVDYDRLDDSQLASLARLSTCQKALLRDAGESKFVPPPPRLLVVVNGSRFHDQYDASTLENALDVHGTEREETRRTISESFPEQNRQFLSIPVSKKTDYDTCLDRLSNEVVKCPPLFSSQSPFDGDMVWNLLCKAVDAINRAERLHPENVYDGVLKQHYGSLFESVLLKLQETCPGDTLYCPNVDTQNAFVAQISDRLAEKMPETKQVIPDLQRKAKNRFDKARGSNHEKGHEDLEQGVTQEEPTAEIPTRHGNEDSKLLGAVTGAGVPLVLGAPFLAPVGALLLPVLGCSIIGGWIGGHFKK